MPKQNKRSGPNGTNNARAIARLMDADEGAPDYDSDNPLDGIPELAVVAATTLIVVHGTFTAAHVINELRYHFEMGNLTCNDRAMLAQLGREVAREMECETVS